MGGVTNRVALVTGAGSPNGIGSARAGFTRVQAVRRNFQPAHRHQLGGLGHRKKLAMSQYFWRVKKRGT